MCRMPAAGRPVQYHRIAVTCDWPQAAAGAIRGNGCDMSEGRQAGRAPNEDFGNEPRLPHIITHRCLHNERSDLPLTALRPIGRPRGPVALRDGICGQDRGIPR